MVSLSRMIWWKEETRSKRKKNAAFAQGVQDLVDAGDGKLTEGADGVQLLVVDGDSDASILFRNGDHGAGIR